MNLCVKKWCDSEQSGINPYLISQSGAFKKLLTSLCSECFVNKQIYKHLGEMIFFFKQVNKTEPCSKRPRNILHNV